MLLFHFPGDQWSQFITPAQYRFHQLSFFDGTFNKNYQYIAMCDDYGNLIGLCCFSETRLDCTDYFTIAYLSIDRRHKKQGHGMSLAHELFRIASELDKGIFVTTYTLEGRLYLKPSMASIAGFYPNVGLLEND